MAAARYPRFAFLPVAPSSLPSNVSSKLPNRKAILHRADLTVIKIGSVQPGDTVESGPPSGLREGVRCAIVARSFRTRLKYAIVLENESAIRPASSRLSRGLAMIIALIIAALRDIRSRGNRLHAIAPVRSSTFCYLRRDVCIRVERRRKLTPFERQQEVLALPGIEAGICFVGSGSRERKRSYVAFLVGAKGRNTRKRAREVVNRGTPALLRR